MVADRIINHIKHITGKKHFSMLFLPYCFDMFDSLESVYLMASDDADIDVSLMPIPYYTLEDGQIGHVLDDSSKYPYPIKQWSKFEGFYDVIVIHNPYDQHNRITSVFPQFYTKKLKEHCDKLVYIPYFCISESADIRSFALTNGVLFSDAVIVQSENIRSKYLEALWEALCPVYNQFNFEEKIVALGSPKMDKKIEIEKPQSLEGKYIILITMSIVAYLYDGEARLRHLDSIMAEYVDKPNTMVILRPHPLQEAMFTSMCPNLLPLYKDIVDSFVRLGGIIDTNELHYSLGIADMLITNASSIELLWDDSKPKLVF